MNSRLCGRRILLSLILSSTYFMFGFIGCTPEASVTDTAFLNNVNNKSSNQLKFDLAVKVDGGLSNAPIGKYRYMIVRGAAAKLSTPVACQNDAAYSKPSVLESQHLKSLGADDETIAGNATHMRQRDYPVSATEMSQILKHAGWKSMIHRLDQSAHPLKEFFTVISARSA